MVRIDSIFVKLPLFAFDCSIYGEQAQPWKTQKDSSLPGKPFKITGNLEPWRF